MPSNALLCAWAGGWPPDVGCIGMSSTIPVVPVGNVNVRDLPGTEANPSAPDLPKGTWATFRVRVEGEWIDGALQSQQVERAESLSLLWAFPMPEPPCDPPAGGWPGEGEGALRAMSGVVGRNPDKYAGVTSAVLTDDEGRPTDYVAVVGTIGDPDELAPFLHSTYPYNLCVVRPERSAVELEEVAAALRKLNNGWDIWIDAAIGRVAVVVPVFDPATADAIQPYAGRVSVRPLVGLR